MRGRLRRMSMSGWLGLIGWPALAVLFGLWLLVPGFRRDPAWFAWTISVCVALLALTHVPGFHHGHPRLPAIERPEQRRTFPNPMGPVRWRRIARPPHWYKGRSRSGGRPQFD
jgi:hypothetical protein